MSRGRQAAEEVKPVFFLSKLLGSPVRDVADTPAGTVHDSAPCGQPSPQVMLPRGRATDLTLPLARKQSSSRTLP